MTDNFNLMHAVFYDPLEQLVSDINARPDIRMGEVAELAGIAGRADILGRVGELCAAKGMTEFDHWHFMYFFSIQAARAFCDDDRQDNSHKRRRLVSEMRLLDKDISLQALDLIKDQLGQMYGWQNASYFARLVVDCGHSGAAVRWVEEAQKALEAAKLDPDFYDTGDMNASFQENGNLHAKQRRLDFILKVRSEIETLPPIAPEKQICRKERPKP